MIAIFMVLLAVSAVLTWLALRSR